MQTLTMRKVKDWLEALADSVTNVSHAFTGLRRKRSRHSVTSC